MIADVFRLLESAPNAIKLYSAARRAANGDAEALQFLKEQGWADALDIFKPGAGSATRELLKHTKEAVDEFHNSLHGNVIDGQYRVVTSYPWEPFVRWIKSKEWGTFVVLGPKGMGKTTLALRLAQLWADKTSYAAYGVNLYPEDRYPFIRPVPIKVFIDEIHGLVDILNEPIPEEDGLAGYDRLMHKLAPYKNRIIVIDEMSLTVSPTGADAGRQLVRQIMAQARHLNWLILYVGQLVRMMPPDLLNCEAVFVKKPTGKEAIVDRQDALTMDLWQRATEAYEKLPRESYYREWSDIRAWAYADAQSISKTGGYQGFVPFSLPMTKEEATE